MKDIVKYIFSKFGYRIYKKNVFTDSGYRLSSICANIKPDLLVDVGANKGQFLKKVRPLIGDVPVLAIEPLSTHNTEIIKVPYNNLIGIINVCVSDSNGVIKFNISENDVCSSILELDNCSNVVMPTSRYVSSVEVEQQRLDDILFLHADKYKKIFVKIDTQGTEDKVLNSIEKKIDNIAIFHVEVSLQKLYKGQVLWGQLLKNNALKDFEIVDIEVISANPLNGIALQADVVFVRREYLVSTE